MNYSAASGEVTIPAGQTSASIPVQTVDDGIYEPNETFSMTLTSATNASLAGATAPATIINIDPAVSVSIGTAGSVTKGDVATFPVWLSNAAGRDVTLSYTTENGSASAPLNYTAASGSVTISAGQLSASIPVQTVDDHINEPNETFSLSLTSATNATLGSATASATILNIDPPLHVNIETPSAVLEGDTVTFSLTLCDPSGQPASCGANVTVSYHTVDGTADGGSAGSTSADYVSAASHTTAVIPAGSTSAEITVATDADDIDEPDETFAVNLDGATHASASGEATGTIQDPSISLSSVTYNDANDLYKDPVAGQPDARWPKTWTAGAQQEPPIWYKRGAAAERDGGLRFRPELDGADDLRLRDRPRRGRDHPGMELASRAGPAPDGTWHVTVNMTPVGQFPDKVLDDPNFQFHWYAAPAGAAASTDLGSSTNELYLSAPLAAQGQYETVVYTGCHYASGQTQNDSIADAIWSNVFSGLTAHKKDGTPLCYYSPSWQPSVDPTTGGLDMSTKSLLVTGNGRCGNWANFMDDVFAAQGLSSDRVQIAPTQTGPAAGWQGFLINNWQFGTPNAGNVLAVQDGGNPRNDRGPGTGYARELPVLHRCPAGCLVQRFSA